MTAAICAGTNGKVRFGVTLMGMSHNQRILIIAEECEPARALAAHLKQQGFHPLAAPSGQEGLRLFHQEMPGLVLLDAALPDEDSLTLCRHLRRESPVPILILSEFNAEQDCVAALEAGADDYLVKPLRLRELTARIHAIRRRTERAFTSMPTAASELPAGPENILEVGDIRLMLTSCRVEVQGRIDTLTPNEFRLLAVLMNAPGEVFTREDLRERVWPKDGQDPAKKHLSLHLVEVHIANLRKKIEEDQHHPKRLITVRSQGYRLATPDFA